MQGGWDKPIFVGDKNGEGGDIHYALDSNGMTALAKASQYNHVAAVEALLAADPYPSHIRIKYWVRLHVIGGGVG